MEQAELRQTIVDFMNGHRKAVFSVLDDEGNPTTSLMLYVIDDELNLYFGTRKAFHKYPNLVKTKIASLTVINGVVDPLRSVDMRGDVEELTPEEQAEIYKFFKSKNPAKYYVEGAEDFVMFKLTPHFVRYLDAEDGELSILPLGAIKG